MNYTYIARLTVLSLALLICAGINLVAAEPAQPSPRSYIVGLTPHIDKAMRDEVWAKVGGLVLKQANAGDSVAVYDALNLKVIAVFVIPKTSNEMPGCTNCRANCRN